MKRGLLLFFAAALIVITRLWNWSQIFIGGQIYFVDADCYSRMTRVASVLAHPGTVLRHHIFENWPLGTTPHTTVPLDYLIAALAVILRPFSAQALDLAGAFSPILFALASGFVLWKWAESFRLRTQIAILLTFAVSPILVHGTVLGRPDHQALLIFLIILALATEWKMQPTDSKKTTRPLAITNGLAWGLALWTSLYEPSILLALTLTGGIAASSRKWFSRPRAISSLTCAAVLLIALLIERWRIQSLPTGPLFHHWAKSIGELTPTGFASPIYIRWASLALLAAPIVLLWQILRKKNLPAILWLILLTGTYLLTVQAARWGYFLVIAFLFTIPFLLEKIRTRWLAAAFFLGFWPVASEWDSRLWPTVEEQTRLAEQREDLLELRQISQFIAEANASQTPTGILAPWWLSPAIAYWSGANCVAGSSHQSLPGIQDTARFYISRFPEKSHEILRARKVTWVLAYEPDRVLSTASSLLDQPAAQDAFAVTLYQSPLRAPSWLKLEKETQFFKLYRVTDQ